jgi:hypothetical protein
MNLDEIRLHQTLFAADFSFIVTEYVFSVKYKNEKKTSDLFE